MDNFNDPCTSKALVLDGNNLNSKNSHAQLSSSIEGLSDWEVVRKGMNLLLNNKINEARKVFLSNPTNNLIIFSGHAFMTFLDAVTTFEEQKVTVAFETLRETERRCNALNTNENAKKTTTGSHLGGSDFPTFAKILESQIILADCLACVASLMFLQQDFTGLFKGGWLMRRSWKTYSSTYENIAKLYKKAVADLLGSQADVKKDIKISSVESIRRTLSSIICTRDEVTLPSQLPPFPSGYCPTPPPLIPLINEKMSHSLSDTFASRNYNVPNVTNNKCPYTENTDIDNVCSSIESVSFDSNSSDKNLDGDTLDETEKSNDKKRSFLKSKINGLKKSKSHKKFMKRSVTINGNISQSQSGFFSSKLFSPLSIFASNLSYITSAFGMESSSDNHNEVVELKTIYRLLCAVSFGYGFFHLATSLLPPSVQRVTSIFGITGDRKKGLEILMFSRLGEDMRSPLATLALLWYFTIVKPYFALNVDDSKTGTQTASQLIAESENEFGESAVFLYYKGKIQILKSETQAAVQTFCRCTQNAAQEEIRMLAFHELAWTHMTGLEFAEAQSIFHFLHLKSRWAMLFYLYLETINNGASGTTITESDLLHFRSIFENPPSENQMETLLIRRFKKMPKRLTDIGYKTSVYWKSLVYELLYLWNSLPNCTAEVLEQIIKDCELLDDDPVNKSMVGLDKLVSGFCYTIKCNEEEAVGKFREGLNERKDFPNTADDAHISAFLNYELGILLVKKTEVINLHSLS
ncbi:tetratricopeptide repeat protein 39C isoform X1 [Agrilus planipennis]|uniref:Tetratricopeptide repeat protein 39C isoform X1 n=1 Tax=Agrilus planipennis TaxID=224129 RepID=A0A7F5RDP8_AGRPL|nr:tetratricopeptide repeat protein 39C isoform X1 [Agrilus planipennis]